MPTLAQGDSLFEFDLSIDAILGNEKWDDGRYKPCNTLYRSIDQRVASKKTRLCSSTYPTGFHTRVNTPLGAADAHVHTHTCVCVRVRRVCVRMCVLGPDPFSHLQDDTQRNIHRRSHTRSRTATHRSCKDSLYALLMLFNEAAMNITFSAFSSLNYALARLCHSRPWLYARSIG